MQLYLKYFVRQKVSIYLLILGIGPHIKGFEILKEAVIRIFEEPDKRFNIKTKLYQDLAFEFNETTESIDRALRHALEVCKINNGFENLEKHVGCYFRFNKPTLKDLIHLLDQVINIDVRNLNLKSENNFLYCDEYSNDMIV